MNNLKKRISVVLIFSMFIAAFTQLYAQDDQRKERFRDEKMKFFNEKSSLIFTKQTMHIHVPHRPEQYLLLSTMWWSSI